jgi:hypothetical protein
MVEAAGRHVNLVAKLGIPEGELGATRSCAAFSRVEPHRLILDDTEITWAHAEPSNEWRASRPATN